MTLLTFIRLKIFANDKKRKAQDCSIKFCNEKILTIMHGKNYGNYRLITKIVFLMHDFSVALIMYLPINFHQNFRKSNDFNITNFYQMLKKDCTIKFYYKEMIIMMHCESPNLIKQYNGKLLT